MREDEGLSRQARRLRLKTLIGLRWLAIAGQTVAILAAAFGFRLQFPSIACFALVGASAVLNLALRWRHPVSTQLSDRFAATLLAYDILQLAGLLFLTGGIANPFAIFFLAPVTIAATSLSQRPALGLLGLALACGTALALWSLPLPRIGGVSLSLPPIYVVGLWSALGVSAAFLTLYAYRVAAEARQTGSALAATELALARAQHMLQLDGLATAAAHSLGTPLATIALVVREMAAYPAPNEGFRDDLGLLEQSVDRCRSLLEKLAAPYELPDQEIEISSPVELAEIAAAPHRLLGVAISVEGEGADPAPKCHRNPGVLYCLGNLIDNAVSFAQNAVVIRATWTTSTVKIAIADDGPGFPPNVLTRVGEPYLSQRDRARQREKSSEGLGLGLFIAKALLERSRGALSLANAEPPATGAIATLCWSRVDYERG